MTDHPDPLVEARLRKAARARRLTDPLGAMGHRQTGERIRRERIARRTLFTGAVATFVALLGAHVTGSPEPNDAPSEPPAIVWAIDQDGRVQAVQVVEAAPVSHVRTRSS